MLYNFICMPLRTRDWVFCVTDLRNYRNKNEKIKIVIAEFSEQLYQSW